MRRTPSLVVSLTLSALGCVGVLLGTACSPGGDGVATGAGPGSGSGGSAQGGQGPGGADAGSGGEGAASPTVTTSQGPGGGSGQGGEGAGAPCAAGTVLCEGGVRKVCDGDGGFSEEENCAPGVCLPEVGCTVCAPGSGSCAGDVSTVCNAAGSGFDTYTCDPVQGVTCNAATGHCDGACSPELLGTSYIGCDYFPTVTDNALLPTGTFAVAVANTSAEAANVQVHQGPNLIANQPVAPGSVQIIALPWVDSLRSAASSSVVADGAYRLRTTRPVTVYQYNPLEYATSNGNTYTNDASLLLPTNAWTGNYRVAARNSFYQWPGLYAVTASQDGTTVTLSPSATGGSIIEGGGVAANGTGTVLLNEGDVLQVLSTFDGSLTSQASDVTGTLIAADKPVQVIGGHRCVYIPGDVAYCDHLEESMPPLETLATEYIIASPQSAAGGADTQFVRIIATDADTTITYDPPQAGAPASITAAGDYVELASSAASYAITASKPVLVAQYMQGKGDSGIPGDPAMALAVATEQYRQQYLFHAPTNYLSNFVNITAPTGAAITLDGAAVAGFVDIGASGYAIARVQLPDNGDGNHLMTGNEPFGISVYGYGDDTSYWYPGGLDLDKLGTQ